MSSSKIPSKALLDASPVLASLWKRGPLSPWDVLPAKIPVRVPVHVVDGLTEVYLLSEKDASRHRQLSSKDYAALVSPDELDHAVGLVRLMLDGASYRNIFSASSAEVRLARLQAARAELQAKYEQEVSSAKARVLAETKVRVDAALAVGFAEYLVAPAGRDALVAAWTARFEKRKSTPPKAGVLPKPAKATLEYFLTCASAVDPDVGFPEQGVMPDRDYVHAAAGAIIGAYLGEEERVLGKDAVSIVAEQTHARWMNLVREMQAFATGGLSGAAKCVFDAIPHLIRLRATAAELEREIGRADSITGLSKCSAEALVGFIDWAKRA